MKYRQAGHPQPKNIAANYSPDPKQKNIYPAVMQIKPEGKNTDKYNNQKKKTQYKNHYYRYC
jgi:hypothetical protein